MKPRCWLMAINKAAQVNVQRSVLRVQGSRFCQARATQLQSAPSTAL